MRHSKSIFLCFFICLTMSSLSLALDGRISTPDDIQLLKKDILTGKIQVGTTRLSDIRNIYG
ncbi:MAG: hypothetical protein KC733_02035, partial [Candidatus Omnitrophica bacterium]|nr:hypothetical protein [Candidatus Omnitrophota bacterium]